MENIRKQFIMFVFHMPSVEITMKGSYEGIHILSKTYTSFSLKENMDLGMKVLLVKSSF